MNEKFNSSYPNSRQSFKLCDNALSTIVASNHSNVPLSAE